MSSSVLLWIALATTLFWAVGAYNRLVRLRSQGLAVFSNLYDLLNQFVKMARDNASDSAALVAAADQFHASLRVSRSQPLNGSAMSALTTAFETLSYCWLRLPALALARAGAVGPDSLPTQWDQLALQIEQARSDFNQSVARYNAAISQFPAVLLASVFGFAPAQPM